MQLLGTDCENLFPVPRSLISGGSLNRPRRPTAGIERGTGEHHPSGLLWLLLQGAQSWPQPKPWAQTPRAQAMDT